MRTILFPLCVCRRLRGVYISDCRHLRGALRMSIDINRVCIVYDMSKKTVFSLVLLQIPSIVSQLTAKKVQFN